MNRAKYKNNTYSKNNLNSYKQNDTLKINYNNLNQTYKQNEIYLGGTDPSGSVYVNNSYNISQSGLGWIL